MKLTKMFLLSFYLHVSMFAEERVRAKKGKKDGNGRKLIVLKRPGILNVDR